MTDDQERVRQTLATRLHDAVKQCQIRFAAKKELATSTESCIACLCSAWEMVLHHGLRRPPKNNIPSSIMQVSQLAGLSRLLTDDSEEVAFWPLVSQFLLQEDRDRFLSLAAITTDTGRGRAWLRAALNEHTLERQLDTMLAAAAVLKQHYRPGAFMLDTERTSMLAPLAAGVNSILFALDLDVAALNSPLRIGYSVPPSSAGSNTSGNRFFAQLSGSANASFDSVDDDAIAAVEVAPPLQRAPPRRRLPPTVRQRPMPGVGAIDTLSVKSEELTLSGSMGPPASGSHKRTASDQMLAWRAAPERPSSRSTSLTSDSIEEAEEAGKSWGDDTARMPVLEGQSRSPVLIQNEAVFEEGPGSRSDGDGGVESPPLSNASLSPEEMRQAMLAVMDNKDAVEAENQRLQAAVGELTTRLAAAEEALEEQRQRADNRAERDQAVIEDLQRENGVLRQQLREYVRSVQLMGETDASPSKGEAQSLVGAFKEREIFQDQETKAKLVQLAQMQGELLELNERLQRSLREKEAVVQRLRNELTHLRGPLPDPNALPSGTGQSTQASRWNPFNQPLVHLWIPIALLQRKNGTSHHVYQVYVRVGDSDEWNVYRRYADFRKAHDTLRKQFASLDRLEFPPKAIKNMREKVVEERRVKLQSYMRQAVNFLCEKNSDTAITKSLLLQYFPILDDSSEFS